MERLAQAGRRLDAVQMAIRGIIRRSFCQSLGFQPVQLLDLLITPAYAQQGGPGQGQNLLVTVFPFIVMIPLFYFMLIRPQMRKAKETRQMLGTLAKGDEIITIGGLAGRISSIGEVYLTVEIAPGVEVKVQKSGITSVLPKGTLKTL
jgi:preprotein translocase subunit YajC